jgi:amidase
LTALNHIQTQCREHGVDAALNHIAADGKTIKLDALLLCDRLGPGQQIAAQAGYPVISIPIGLDDEGLPVGLSLQHTAWEEDTLIKWASAIESVVRETLGWRPTPTYNNHLAKNIPIL